MDDLGVTRADVRQALVRVQQLREQLAQNVIYQKEAGAVSDQVR